MSAGGRVALVSDRPKVAANNVESDRYFAISLARGLAVLRCFTPISMTLGNKELATATGLPKSTVSRITYTLTTLGYLRHNVRIGKYQLGPAVLCLSYPLLVSMTVRSVAYPFMEALAEYSGGAVSLAVRDRLSIVIAETCCRGDVLRSLPDAGASMPIAKSATGYALLAACAPSERDALLNRIRVNEPTDFLQYKVDIANALNQVRELGYCTSRSGPRGANYEVASPLTRPVDGELLVFSCSVHSLKQRRREATQDIGSRLVETVRSVETALGLARL